MPATTACDRSLRVMTAGDFSRPLIAALAILIGAGTGAAQSLPTGWASQDIGAVGLAGRATYSGATFTIQGAGADIWGTADSFHFANRLLIGDGQIVARVASMGNTHAFAKAGVMIREALTGASRHVLLDLKPGGGVEFMARDATGGVTSYIAGGTGRWLKLARSNGVVTASVSADGVAWTVVGSRAVTMGVNVWVGLIVCSHNTGALNTATFDNVTVEPAGGTEQPPSVSITSPTAASTFAAGASIAIAATATTTAASVAAVSFYANNGTTNSLLGTDTTNPYAFTWTNVPAGSYSLTAVATDTANRSGTSNAVAITVAPPGGGLPTGWVGQDIGGVGRAGSSGFADGTFTIQGAGADIWGTADSFFFVNRLLSGDGQIVARVASMDNTHAYAKAGVMIRETLTAGSPHVLLDMKPNGNVEFLARAAAGGTTAYVAGGTGRWLRLARSNGVFTAAVSTDGASWTLVGSRAVSMAGNVWVGLAVCSHNTSLLNTALFDSVTVTSTGGGGAPPTVSITSPPNGSGFTAGASVTVNADAAGGASTPVARVDFYANGAPIGTDTTSPYSVTWTNVAAGSYSLTAVATDTANQATTSSAVGITVLSAGGGGSLPAGWANRDIGAVGIPGSASFDNGTFTLRGAGADIWAGVDAFHFASKPLVGTGEIVTHVASMSNTHRYAKAGVMIRNSSSPNSPHVTLDMRPDGTVELIYRSVQGGATFHVDGGSGSWLRLVRGASDQFTAYVSTDGNTWRQIGSAAVAMSSATVEMGLVVCSQTVTALNTATFDHVSHNSPPSPKPAPVITSPPSGTTFLLGSAPVVTATASENVVIDFYANDGTTNRFLGTFNNLGANRPPTFMWFTPQAGTYSVTAVAHYTNNEWVTSNPVTIHVSSTPSGDVPPTARITNPPLGQVTGTQVTLTAETRDPDSTPVVRVDYWLEEWFYDYSLRHTYIGGATASPYAVNWTPAPGMVANIIAIATDSAGLATATYVWVQVPLVQ